MKTLQLIVRWLLHLAAILAFPVVVWVLLIWWIGGVLIETWNEDAPWRAKIPHDASDWEAEV